MQPVEQNLLSVGQHHRLSGHKYSACFRDDFLLINLHITVEIDRAAGVKQQFCSTKHMLVLSRWCQCAHLGKNIPSSV